MSDFKRGDRVELLEEATDLSWGPIKVPIGTQGTLGHMYRVQDGLEMWPMWLDQSHHGKWLLGVTHKQIKKL